ncbi:MAG: DUF134 domain-containing protein [Desulfobacterales bacterium]|nr:DUF134 domain-containing protein [Desulfobacterales bacterium]
MPRPLKERRVGYIPEVTYFKPAGIPIRDLEEVVLTLEEVEAIRLKDQQGLMQKEAAQLMQISRPTFQRILMEARKKVSDALILGKALRFEGGDYRLVKKYRCAQCDEEFEEVDQNGTENKQCPECGNPFIDKPIKE